MKPKIFDFSTRLPGPMAGYLFTQKGFEVFKCENIAYPDAFAGDSEKLFNLWYENFNRHKIILRGDDNYLKKSVLSNLGQVNIFLVPSIAGIKKMLGSIPEQSKTLWIQIAGGKGENKNAHDLNAIAQTGIFKLHLQQSLQPPFVPLAGIAFAQEIVSNALSWLFEFDQTVNIIEKTIYLEEAVDTVFGPLWENGFTDDLVFLHNGKFPCYNIYAAQDCYLAVAAVEEKFWKQFTQAFALNLSIEDRLSTRPEVKEIVSQKLMSYKRQQLEAMPLANMCLTIIDK